MDPTLKVMVVTKKSAAKHIESLQLPSSLEEKFGRLVGATELEKGAASQTKLDILPATLSYAPSKLSLVAEVASTRNVGCRTAR